MAMKREDLEAEIRRATGKLRKADRQIAEGEALRAKAEREVTLLAELARVWGWDVEPLTAGVHGGPTARSSGPLGPTPARRSSPSKEAVLSAVIEVLSDCREPVQIGELMSAVLERNVRIPGAGRQANLIGVINGDDRIVRARRGFYALADAPDSPNGVGATND